MNGKNHSGNGESSGHHHHHHRKSPWRIFKHKVKKVLYNKKWIVPSVVIALALLLAAGYWMYATYQGASRNNLTAGNQVNIGSGYRNIVYKGKEYRYNSLITSILYVGVDSDGPMAVTKYMSAPNADSISLVVMDERIGKMTIIGINRNTITPIHRYSLEGIDLGEFNDQLCLAYSYGENGVVSSRNLCRSVSKLLYGIPINEYVITNRSSLPEIMNVLGDVTVTVPNDDLVDEGFYPGDTAVIDSGNVETFVRKRDTEVDFSNVGRMERQKTFINATIDKIMDNLTNNPTDLWKKIEKVEYCYNTNVTRSRYVELANTVSKMTYDAQNYYIPEGRNVVGTNWDEFYVNESELLDNIINIFYIEK